MGCTLTTAFFAPHRREKMKSTDQGKMVVVFISEHHGHTKSVKGMITKVIDDDIFEVEDSNGLISRWNERQIKGIKFLGED